MNFYHLGKRSRKAQQEAKNKNGGGDNSNNNDEKHSSRSSASVSSNNHQSSAHRNGISEKVMTNLTNSNYHFSKSIDISQQNTAIPLQHQRHSNSAKEVLPNGVEESFSSNLINRPQSNVPFINGGEDMIWRVV